MDITKELADFKKKFDPVITDYLDEAIAEARKKDSFVAQALVHVKKIILSGGKRLRPALVRVGYLTAGGQGEKAIMQAAASVELIHAFLLMHDDIIDKDDLRHGVPTLHAFFHKKARILFGTERGEHLGTSVGIIMGDLLYALGNRKLFTAHFLPQRIIAALTRLQSIVSLTVIGEMQDVHMEYRGRATEKNILSMYENKTARYTIEGPLHLGAILAGASEALLKKMSVIAVPLGISFQISDDILGIFGSQEKIGKPIGSDVADGKMTFLVARAQRCGTATQKKTLQRLLGAGKLSTRDIATVRGIFTDTGALTDAQNLARKYSAQGKRAIMQAQLPRFTHDFLFAMAEYIIQRKQ